MFFTSLYVRLRHYSAKQIVSHTNVATSQRKVCIKCCVDMITLRSVVIGIAITDRCMSTRS